MDQLELQAEVIALQRRVKFLLAIIRLAFLLVRLSGFQPRQALECPRRPPELEYRSDQRPELPVRSQP